MVVCTILWLFLAGANATGFWAIRHDKKAARSRAHRASSRSRIPEVRLHAIAFFGGFPAMLYAMGRYRHKTRKLPFQIVLGVAALASTVAWVGWLSVLGCLGGLL